MEGNSILGTKTWSPKVTYFGDVSNVTLEGEGGAQDEVSMKNREEGC